MIDVARKLDKADREGLTRCAFHLKRMEQYAYAGEIYTKMGDTKALVMLHVDARHWEDVSVLSCSLNLTLTMLKYFCLTL